MHNRLLRNLFLASFVATTLSAIPASADNGKYELRYRYRMGEVLRYRVLHQADMRSTIEGSTQEAESKSESIKAWKVTDVLPSGEIEFVHLVEAVRMSNRTPNQPEMKYDSEKDSSPPPAFRQAAGSIGVPLSVIRINSNGESVSREEKHPQPVVTEDMPITLRLPDEPVAVGDEWDMSYHVEVERKSGDKMKVRTRRVCTLKSVKRGMATIAVEYQVLTPVSAFIESQLIQRLTKGTVRFDLKRGRIISQKFEADHRVLGFAGEASSMRYVSRMEEQLLKPGQRLARKR